MSGMKRALLALARTGDDEPVFVLRAQDKFMLRVVNYWLECVRKEGGDTGKTRQVTEYLNEIEAWQRNNPTKIPD